MVSATNMVLLSSVNIYKMQKQRFCEVQHLDVEFGTNIKNVKNQKHTIWAPVKLTQITAHFVEDLYFKDTIN